MVSLIYFDDSRWKILLPGIWDTWFNIFIFPGILKI